MKNRKKVRPDLLNGRTPEQPQNWRDLFDPGYDYPDDLLEEARATSGRRGARRVKKAWRAADAQARKDWRRDQLAEMRREDERRGSAAPLITVLVVAAVIFGAGVAKTFLGRDDQAKPAAAATSTVSPTGSASPVPTAAIPSVTRSVTAAAVSSVPDSIREWVSVFYTRDPAGTGETYQQLVSRAGAWMTPALVANLSEYGDPTYDQLAAERGSSTVKGVEITKPTEGSVPTDTPVRVFKVAIVKIAVDYADRKSEQFEVRLLLELIPGSDGWVVATIGGDGHEDAGE